MCIITICVQRVTADLASTRPTGTAGYTILLGYDYTDLIGTIVEIHIWEQVLTNQTYIKLSSCNELRYLLLQKKLTLL